MKQNNVSFAEPEGSSFIGKELLIKQLKLVGTKSRNNEKVTAFVDFVEQKTAKFLSERVTEE